MLLKATSPLTGSTLERITQALFSGSIPLLAACALFLFGTYTQLVTPSNIIYGDYGEQQGTHPRKKRGELNEDGTKSQGTGRVYLNDYIHSKFEEGSTSYPNNILYAAFAICLSLIGYTYGADASVYIGLAKIFLLCVGSFMLFKTFTVAATLVPHPRRELDPEPPALNTNCVKKEYGKWNWNPVSFLGLFSGKSVATCTDFIPSGHTFNVILITTLTVLYTDVSPWIKALLWISSLSIMPALAVTRLHYTVDTLVGFAIASLLAVSSLSWKELAGVAAV